MQYRKILEVNSQRLQNHIDPMLRQISFTGDGRTVDLLAVLAYSREKDGKLNPKMPLDFLTPDERKTVLNTSDGFRISLCKVYLFQHVVGAVKLGNLNLDGSYKYRPMDDYLISKDRWERKKQSSRSRRPVRICRSPLGPEYAEQGPVPGLPANKSGHIKRKQSLPEGCRARKILCEDIRSGQYGNGPHAKHHAKTIDPVIRGSGDCSPTLRDAR